MVQVYNYLNVVRVKMTIDMPQANKLHQTFEWTPS